MTNKRILTLITLLLFLFLLAGCDWPWTINKPPEITSTAITTATVGVEYIYDVDATDPDAEDVLNYSLIDEPGGMLIDEDNGVITWTPAIDDVGDVDVTVEVSDGKLSDTQDFTITVSPVELDHIVVDPKEMSLFVGEERTIDSVTAHYNFGSPQVIALTDCTYPLVETSTDKVITVEDGVVKAVGSGTVAVIVTYQGKTDKLLVTVKPALLDHIVVDPKEMSLFVGESDTIDSVTAHYNDESTKDINFEDCDYALTSTSPNVVEVSKEGEISALTPGIATITVSYKGKTDTIKVTVKPILPGELTAREFAYISNYSHPCGPITGYTTSWNSIGATFEGIKSMVVKLYSGDTLLQTNTATAKVGIEVIGKICSSSFDIFGTFDYVCDGYWINVRESEYGGSLYVTRVVAIVTLANGKVVTAENTNPTGI